MYFIINYFIINYFNDITCMKNVTQVKLCEYDQETVLKNRME